VEHDLLYWRPGYHPSHSVGCHWVPRGESKIGVILVNPSRNNTDSASGQRRVSVVLVLALASALVLGGIGSTPAADSVPSQCIACHTDAAKLKPLTPPDPPPTEEGEG